MDPMDCPLLVHKRTIAFSRSSLRRPLLRYFPFHILLELSCKTQKAPHQICIFSPQFGVGHGHCFLTKQFSQPSALDIRFHAWATEVATRPLPPMPVPITNLMRNQVAHYHCTTGGSPLWLKSRHAQRKRQCPQKARSGHPRCNKRTPRFPRQISRPSSGWRPQHASTRRSQPG